MKGVLISIQPYYVFLIIARLMGWDIPQEKTVEVRKDFPKAPEWNRVTYIYCSKNRKSFNRIPKQYQPLMEKLLGKVIGEFVCDKIDEFHEWELQPGGKFQEPMQNNLDNFLKAACLTLEEVCDRRGKLQYYQPLYLWHITDLKIYDTPAKLELVKENVNCFETPCECCKFYRRDEIGLLVCDNTTTHPPQSWQYVEVWED